MYPRILALGLAALCVSARAADLIPIEDFAKYPAYSDLRLSPDGRYCASLRAVNGRNFIEFTDFAAATVQKFDPGRAVGSRFAGGEQRSVLRYRWLGSKRVLADFTDGTAAFDRDGKNWTPISGSAAATPAPILNRNRPGKELLVAKHVIYNFHDDVHALMLKHPWQGASVSLYPQVINMNTETGIYETVVSNPGDVVDWISDRKGVVRAGVQLKSVEEINLIYREDEKSPWRVLADLSNKRKEPPALHGFCADGEGVYVVASNISGYKVLYRCDLGTGHLGEPLLEVSGYDMDPSSAEIWSDYKQAIVGFTYTTDGPHLKCFDEEFTRNMAEIDNLLPNTFNRPVSVSDSDRRILILSSSDRNPGAYYLYSTETKKLDPVLRVRPWIKPEQMAPMNPITYTARDGLEIHGYLTIPLGQKPRYLPLVVMPHGGPLEVRDKWGFDPLVQMLASRGYAVLQVNYRGSAGYGEAFARKGEREVGGVIQQDIEDATRWAIAKKVADPKHIAIVGAGRFGGFSVLYALGKSPDLYCCGITVAGIIDWLDVYNNLDGPERDFSRQHLAIMIGDPKTEEEKFRAISPVNFADKITAPVLFIYKKNDFYVSPGLVRKTMAASKNAGGKPEVLFIDEGANVEERTQIEKYTAIEAFLAKYLGPGVVTAPAVNASLPAAEAAGKK